MTEDTRTGLIDMKRQLTPSNVRDLELKKAFTKRPAQQKKFKGRVARLKGMETLWEPFKKQIDNYIAKKNKESKNLPEKISRLRAVIKEECAHPMDTLVVTDRYDSGDVDNAPFTEYYVTCKLCGKKEKMKTEVHEYY